MSRAAAPASVIVAATLGLFGLAHPTPAQQTGARASQTAQQTAQQKSQQTARPVRRAVAPGAASRASAKAAARDAAALTSLDTWLVVRLRGAELLPDSAPAPRSMVTDAVLPRIESVRDGQRADTLYALSHTEHLALPLLAAPAVVRIVGPTGTVTPIVGNVIARRPFRARRAPKANTNDEKDWRYGWAYMIVLPKAGRTTPAAVFRGWMVIDTIVTR